MTRAILGSVLTIALALPATAASADADPLPWVRVTTAEEVVSEGLLIGRGRAVQGRLAAVLDDGTLVLTRPGERVFVPAPAVARVDVRRRESKRVLGGVFGAAAAGSLAFLAGGSGGSSCRRDVNFFCVAFDEMNEDLRVAGALLGVAVGGAIGALLAPDARWDRNVGLDDVHLSVSATPRRGLGVVVAVSF